MIFVTLPYPPTSNHNTMVAHGRRISSPKYRAWRSLAEQSARLQVREAAQIAGPYRISYIAQRPDRRRRDIENLPKSLADALQAAGVITDDSNCEASEIAWADCAPTKDATVAIRITPIGKAF